MYKKLNHINLKYYYQFITFRTFDSVDSYVKRLQDEDIKDNKKQYQIDKYLDNSKKGNYLTDDRIDLVKSILFEKDKILYDIEAFSIMPNHIHILIKQLSDLYKIVKFIKGKSAIELNKKLNRSGKFWESGYFDKLIRDEEHYNIVVNYIINNPIKANLFDYKIRVYNQLEQVQDSKKI